MANSFFGPQSSNDSINCWNVAHVTNMNKKMFVGANEFNNHLIIGTWQVCF